MTRRYLSTLIAIAVLVALWFSFKAWNKHKSHEQANKPSAQKILALSSGQIDAFTITSRDGTSFTCAKQGNTWSIVKPQAITADQSKIKSFLQSLTSATVDQVISPHPADLKEFGLDPAEETIQVSAHEKQQNTLRLGEDTPTSTGIYAQAGHDPRVVTISDDLKTALEKKLFDLRDTRAVTLDTSKLQRIQVKSGADRYTLVKNPDGDWDVSLPPDVRADHFTVEGLVNNLQGLTMQSVVSERKGNQANYGFRKPVLTMTLTTPGANQALVVGKKGSQGYYAMNSALNPVFTLDEDSVSQFQKPAADLRDKNLFSWDMFDVNSFAVSTPKNHWTFQHVKDKWRQTAPTSRAVPADKVDAFLSALRDLQASSFPAAKTGQMDKFGFANPSYTFKVQFGAKNQTEVVDVAKAGGHVYARRAADPLPSELDSSALAPIEKAFQPISK